MHINAAPFVEQTALGFGVTLLVIVALAKVAPVLGLLDKPDSRKQHDAPVPLVGGLAIFSALVVALLLYFANVDFGLPPSLVRHGDVRETLSIFLVSCFILVAIGALDDRLDLGVFSRILTEFAVAAFLIEALHLQLHDLGDLFDNGPVVLHPLLGYVLGLVIIVGIVNAFNMLDGLDGLLAALVLCVLLAYRAISNHPPGLLGMTFAGALLAFLGSNMRLIPRLPKVFLGDAGSKLMGFTVVALLLTSTTSRAGDAVMTKVTALFVVGIPLFDMGYVTLRRLAQGKSPVRPDRSHIHHLIKACGASDRRTVGLIVLIQMFIGFIGWVLHRSQVPEHLQFGLFVAGFFLYAAIVQQAWQALDHLQRPNPQNARINDKQTPLTDT